MTVPSFIACSLVVLTAAAALPAALKAKDAVLTRAAPLLAGWISGTTLAAGDDVTGIVVLGGSVSRVREAIKLAGRYPKATVLLTGPGDVEKAMASSEGSIRSRLVLDLRARNTFENAWLSKSIVRPRAGERWLLVTSAVHMPRALTAFSAAGFQVEPWPVQDTPRNNLLAARQVQHELLGLLAYRLLGRTKVLISSPGQHAVTTACPSGLRH